jgi:Icc-related predicted phosphoesterase
MASQTRTTVEYLLRPLWRSDRPRKLLLLAAAPSGSLGWPEGKPLVWDLIDSHHPDLCVVYGGSDPKGSRRVGNTLVVNPGYLADGWAAWLDWRRSEGNQVDVIDLAVQE